MSGFLRTIIDIALAALVVFVVLWFVALAPRSDASTYLVTEDGAVVAGVQAPDELLIIRANDVTVTDSTFNRLWHQRPYTGLTATDSTFAGDDPSANIGAVVQPDTLLDGVTITGHKDGLYIETGGPVTVRDSFIDIRSDLPDNHSDGVTLPFASNFNGNADFLIEATTIWAEGKTAAFNQQGLPLTVLNSVWSGDVYAAEGSSYTGFAQNPDALRLYGRPVPWEVSRAVFDGVVDYDVRPLSEFPEPSSMLSLLGLWALRRPLESKPDGSPR